MLQVLQQSLPHFEKRGASLVAISPEPPDLELETVKTHELEFHVLSDIGLNVGTQFGVAYELTPELDSLAGGWGLNLRERNQTEKPILPLGVTYVIDQAGVIQYAYLSVDYTRRAEPAEIIAALERINQN